MTAHPVDVVMNDAHPTYGDFVSSLTARLRRRRRRRRRGGGSGGGPTNGDDDDDAMMMMTTAATTTTAGGDDARSLDGHYDCVILSPGPGRPGRAGDMGIVPDVIRSNPDVPILGVCLGHQALGHVYGRAVTLAPRGPVHGLLSPVFHDEGGDEDDYGDDDYDDDATSYRNGSGNGNGNGNGMLRRNDRKTCRLFRGLPREFNVVRYHSLVVDFSSSSSSSSTTNNGEEDDRDADDDSEIEPIAWCTSLVGDDDAAGSAATGDAVCMALRHKRHPHYGVQFHPESIGTGHAGYRILRNFCDFASDYYGRNASKEGLSSSGRGDGENESNDDVGRVDNPPEEAVRDDDDRADIPSKYRVFVHRVDNGDDEGRPLPSPRRVFEELYSARPNSFWLDSSTGEEKNAPPSGGNTNNNDDGNDVYHGDGGCPIASNSRFSIMGSNDGPLSRKIEFYGREHDVERRGLRVIPNEPGMAEGGEVAVGAEQLADVDILSYLRRKLEDEREFVDRAEIVAFDKSSNDGTANDDNKIDATISSDSGYSLYRMEEFAKEQREEEDALAGVGNELVLPFDYRGGYVGYLGYEVRHETQCRIFEREGGAGCDVASDAYEATASSPCTKTNPSIPTASFLFVDRSLLYDHQTGDWYMIGIAENDVTNSDHVGDTIVWMRGLRSKIESMGGEQGTEPVPTNNMSKTTEVAFVPSRSREQYEDDISRSHREIRNGESYELCVTNQFEAELRFPPKKSSPTKKTKYHESPFELYKRLRQRNPAPFSAFMNFYNDEGSRSQSRKINTASVSICCSSPERFLSVKKAQSTATSMMLNKGTSSPGQHRLPRRQFVVESKPIKGTAARYAGAPDGVIESDEHARWLDSQIATGLSESVKDRAENLMIVDLLRNDLGRVCQVGSVHVPKLMQIESYATVHQMVSTVRGTLDGDAVHAIDVIEACFPGGSMTGAPKQRAMEILDEIERGVSRGPYSGCLGYISLNGCMDMNIVIRSAILTPSDDTDNGEDGMESWKVSVGCGGAITALSDSNDEYEEMLLKSRIVRSTISDWVAQTATERIRHRRHVDDSSVM